MDSAFDSVADVLPEPMLLVDTGGRVVAVNRACAAWLGRAGDTLTGRLLRDLGWTDAELPDYLRRCAATRQPVLGAATFRDAGGQPLAGRCEGVRYAPAPGGAGPALVLLRVVPKESASSRFIALTQKIEELSQEISRRRRAEEDLREQRELLHVTLSSIGDAVIATDAAGRVSFMNEVAERLTGWPFADAAGRPAGEVFVVIGETSRQPVENPVDKVLSLGTIVGLANHSLLVGRDGTERPIDDSGAPIVDAAGRLRGVVLVFRDVTELRAAERRQAAARRAAEAANRAKDEFLATLSHELRTPLNAILGWTRMLRSGTVEGARQDHGLAVIERNAEMQARLIEDLLDVSRITTGQLRLLGEAVDIRQVIELAVEAVKPAALNKQVRLTTAIDVRSSVRGDLARLQQVLWNLLTNAVKFTPAGGHVGAEATEGDGVVRIVIRDSGEGFQASFKPYLFDAFRQADASPGRPHGGLGLGLTIVQRLVEAHGGRIEGDSPGPGRGAVFTITLPASLEPPEAAMPAASADADLGGCTILVVDDDADSRDLLRVMLETAGARVVTADGAREGLARLQDDRIHVLLADIAMRRKDGLWMIKQVRALPARPQCDVPAIAVTAYASRGDRHAALAAGYDDHVQKPVDRGVLVASIHRARRARAGTPDTSR